MEDHQAYDLEDAFISSLTTDKPEFYEHDEDANMALVTRVDATKSDSDDDDDGWLGFISNDEH